MNELQRVKDRVAELKLSLEAVATVAKRKPKDRPLSEALEEWRDIPPAVSPALIAQNNLRLQEVIPEAFDE